MAELGLPAWSHAARGRGSSVPELSNLELSWAQRISAGHLPQTDEAMTRGAPRARIPHPAAWRVSGPQGGFCVAHTSTLTKTHQLPKMC